MAARRAINSREGLFMPLQRIQNNCLYVTLSDGQEITYSDNLFNRVNMLKDNNIRDIKLTSGEYIKKDFNIIHSF